MSSGRPRRPAGRSLRARLLLCTSAVLAVVCAAMALTTVHAQRACLLGGLDRRVGADARHARNEAGLHPDHDIGLAFLGERGQPAGMLAARLDERGRVTVAEVVTRGAAPRPLGDAQRAALDGIRPDGSTHTRTVPGLGTYRVTALDGDGVRVLTGLPMDEVQDVSGGLVVIEVAVAAVGLTAAGCVCAVVIRRQLRPLRRVAATAVEVSRAPLGQGEATRLLRVPDGDTDPGTEAGQIGAALNRLIAHVESSLAERRRSEERVRHSEERMRRFLADAGHELRTPLASIAGYAELMNRGTGPIEPEPAWRHVTAESARMTRLVEDLLLLARLDEGRPLHSAEVDLASLVTEAMWEARAAGGDHDWQLALPLDTPALVVGDEARLHQAVAHLLANARVHTPAGTTVVASVEATGERCVIRVRDDGPGIPAALLPTVFERFTRADVSRSRTHGTVGGSGLGLAIAAAITAAHGGSARVRSVPGRTEFTLELPLAKPSSTRSLGAPTGTRSTPPPGPPRTVPAPESSYRATGAAVGPPATA
ncbi:sensor histidine kinase [Streptomyces sp. NPDC001848]|uniref:sensor histidine kinase n=1 Tax=Streptomyces sp. NPDC001848 TaxID=3364618 RepID=UPI003677D28E